MRTVRTAALPPAPGEDQHPALALVNTVQTTPAGSADLIADPELAGSWLTGHSLLPEDVGFGEPCTIRLHALRQALRTLLACATSATPPPAEAIAAVNTALTAAPTAGLLAWDPAQGLHRSARHPLDQATDHLLARIAVDAVDLLTGPGADKLAACGAAPCSRFLVRTHGARQWCSVRCGDRIRAARAYARRTHGSST